MVTERKSNRQPLSYLSFAILFPTETNQDMCTHIHPCVPTYCRYKELLNIRLQQLGFYKLTFYKVFVSFLKCVRLFFFLRVFFFFF